MWKPGQIVTIDRKKYRVKSVQHWYLACSRCALNCRYSTNAICDSICFSVDSKLDGDQYLEEIPAKGKVLAK